MASGQMTGRRTTEDGRGKGEPAGSGRPFRVLVVDDEPDLQPLIKSRMRPDIRQGLYQFLFAQDGAEAMEILAEEGNIDMVLTDINMPRMDGLTLLNMIPTVDPNIRSVIVSAYGDMKNIRTAMNRGAFDFVVKPLDFEDLRITIERTRAHLYEWKDALASRQKLVTLQSELETAREMQQSILPIQLPNGPRYNMHGSMEPAENIGGDFFDVFRLRDEKVGLAVADVSGKGIPAALFMMASRTLLKGAAIGLDQPGEVLTEVNRALHEENRRSMFVTIIYAVYEPGTGELVYANGGHCAPLVVQADGACRELESTRGIVLGLAGELEYEQREDRLQPGDTLVLYSDGVSEARNQDDEEFGEERLRNIFLNDPPESAAEANERIQQAVGEFARGMPQADDLTCLILHRAVTE